MTDLRAEKTSNIGSAIQMLQLIALLFGVAGIFTMIGRRDQDLDMTKEKITELRLVCADLAKVVGSLSVSDALQTVQLQSIDRRLEQLQNK